MSKTSLSVAQAVVVALSLNSLVSRPAVAAPRVDEVVAEQAEILVLRGPAGENVEGFLVVWNGTVEGVRITDVTSEAFRDVEFVQTERTGAATSVTVRQGLSIPPHAELVMRRRGVYLRIEPSRSLKVGDVVALKVVFEDGSTQAIEAEVRRDEAALEAHLHDPAGRPWRRELKGALPMGPAGRALR